MYAEWTRPDVCDWCLFDSFLFPFSFPWPFSSLKGDGNGFLCFLYYLYEFMVISWMHPFFVVLSFEEERGRQNKKILGVSVPKRPFSFSGSWYSENILWQIVAGYSSIDVTHGKNSILHGGVRCFLFLPVLSIVNSISESVVASEY